VKCLRRSTAARRRGLEIRLEIRRGGTLLCTCTEDGNRQHNTTNNTKFLMADQHTSLAVHVPQDQADSLPATLPSLVMMSDNTPFSTQTLRFNHAVAPLLPRPIAPFAKRERKRALTNATYYSECCLHRINPLQADTAAMDAQSRFDKWWVQAKFQGLLTSSNDNRNFNSSTRTNAQLSASKKQRVDEAPENNVNTTLALLEKNTFYSSTISVGSVTGFSLSSQTKNDSVLAAKRIMISNLQESGGDIDTPVFLQCLDVLHLSYASKGWDARWTSCQQPVILDGNWLTLSKPTFSECIGRNQRGEYQYTLGRMAFDMFRPTHLKCFITGTYNWIQQEDASAKTPGRPHSIPRRLRQVGSNNDAPLVRNYE
jgi:hypothetical protein